MLFDIFLVGQIEVQVRVMNRMLILFRFPEVGSVIPSLKILDVVTHNHVPLSLKFNTVIVFEDRWPVRLHVDEIVGSK